VRISDSWQHKFLQRQVEQVGDRMAEITMQLSSGRKVLRPGQDPAATERILFLRTGMAEAQTQREALEGAAGELRATDAALGVVHDLLHQARDICVEGGNSALPEAGLAALAEAVEALRQRMIDVANERFAGLYVFGGTETQSPPFAETAGPGSPVAYLGNGDSREVPVAPGRTAAINVPGDRLFNMGGAADPSWPDVFEALSNLAQDLRNGDREAVSTTRLKEIDELLNHALELRGETGATAQRVEAAISSADDAVFHLREALSDVEATDLTEGITELKAHEVAYQAALSSVAAIANRPNLFDLLRL